VLVGVLLDLFLNLIVLCRSNLVEVVLLSSARFDTLLVVLECLISVFKESQLVIAILNGSVEHFYADLVAFFLQFVLSIVARSDVVTFILNLNSVVLSGTAFILNVSISLFVMMVAVRFFDNLIMEHDAVVVGVGNGFLSGLVLVEDGLSPVVAHVKSVLGVLDLHASLDSVVSPRNGVLVTTDFEFSNPLSQKSEKSLPVIAAQFHELRKLVHDVLVHSEVGRYLLVDVLQVFSFRVDTLAEIASWANIAEWSIGIFFSIIVLATLRYDSFFVSTFFELRFSLNFSSFED